MDVVPSPDAATATANTAAADLVQLRCRAPADVALRRVRQRSRGVSDADETVARELAAALEPWPDAITIDMSDSRAGGVRRARVSGVASTRCHPAARTRPG